MARTSLGPLNPLTKKLYDRKILREAPVDQFFGKFSDKSGNNIVHEKGDLESGEGDTLTFGIRMRNPMKAIVDGRLEGNEQKLSTFSDKVELHSYKVGYADDGALSRKRACYDTHEEMLDALQANATEVIENNRFDALFASGHSQIKYLGSANSVGTLTAADKITATFLAKLYTLAKTGGHRDFLPIRPVKFRNASWYIFLAHPDVVFDLSQDPTMQQANREARERGIDNPLFTESDLVYRNVLVYSHEKVPIFSNGGASNNVPYATNMLLGAQALIAATGMAAKIKENWKDYNDELGIGWHLIEGVKRPMFNGKTVGSIEVICARTDVA